MVKRIGSLVAGLIAISSTASAATLTVFTTDTSNVERSVFDVGETILLNVTGDAQGGTDIAIEGRLVWDGSLTTTVIDPSGCRGSLAFPCTTISQGDWLPQKGSMIPADGSVYAFNQISFPPEPVHPTNQVDTSVITLVADAPGSTGVTWGGTFLDFFDIYVYNNGAPISVPTGHSFTITGAPPIEDPGDPGSAVPEPSAALVFAVGLIAARAAVRRRD